MQKHWLNKIASVLLIAMLALAFLPVTPVHAATTFTSIASGNWTDSTIWDVGGGSIPNPANRDSVIIANGHTVTLTGATTVGGSLTINSGATLNTANFGLTFNGDFTNDGTFNAVPSSSNIAFSDSSDQNVDGFTTSGTVSMTKTGGTVTFTGNVSAGGLTISGLGGTPGTLNLGAGLTHTITGTWTRTAGTLEGGSSTLNLGGAFSGTGGTFTEGAGTVNYNAAGAQTVAVLTYNNLTLSGSGAKTITTTSIVNGVLSMEGDATASAAPTYGTAATLRYNRTTARTAGSEWMATFAATGGVIIANTGAITMNAAKVFNANVPLTINSGATLNTANFGLTFNGDFTNNGTFTNVNSAITMSGTAATQSIAGFTTTGLVSMTKTVGTATFTGNVSAGGLTINGSGGTLNLGSGLTHTFTGNWTRTNGTLEGGSSTLNLNGGLSGASGTFTPGTGTVNYGGAAQTIAAVPYNNLTLSGSGIKTLAAALTIDGNLTISTSTTLDVSGSNYALNVGGNWANSGTFNPRTGTATVTLQGASAQTISGATATTFNRLTINNTSGGVTLSTNATVNGVLTLTSGKITTDDTVSLIIGTVGSVTGASATRYVFGDLQKNFTTGPQSFTFDIGDATNYTPVAVAFANVSTTGNVTASTTAGEHPNIATIVGLDRTKDVNRYWTLTPAGSLGFSNYSATFNFVVPDDIDFGADTTKFIVERYSSGWFSTTTGSQLATSTQATGMTAMSSFAVGELDNTAPTVTSVNSPTLDGSYKAGDLIAVTVTFSEIVNVTTGTPTLQLETGTIDQIIDYASGSGTNILTFNYIVHAGDTSSDLDYVATNSLVGTIKDLANNDAILTLPSPGAPGSLGFYKAIVIDTTAPTVDTFTATSPSNSLNIPITAFTASDAVGVTGYMITTSTTPPTAGATDWTATAPATYTVASDGTYILYPWAKDAAGNVSALFASPREVVVDTAAPNTTITDHPANPDNDSTPTFTFSGDDGTGSGIASFMCKMDSGSYAACTSPFTSSALSDGSHTFYVYAIDNLGNADASPDSYTWTISTTFRIYLPLVLRN
jgi:hypothetical protein